MGWNGSDQTSTSRAASKRGSSRTPSPHSNGVRNGLIALVLIALVGGAAWWFLSTPMSQPTPVPEPEEENPVPVERTAARDGETHATPATKPRPTASDATSATVPATQPGAAETRVAELAATNALPAKKKPIRLRPIFEEGTDQLIAWATFTKKGAGIPPLPRIEIHDTEKFIESLTKPIEILEDDTPTIRMIKEHVSAVRLEIADAMRENPKAEFGDILNDHRKTFNENLEIRTEVQREYRELREAGDEAGAKDYRRTMNIALQQMGIEEIPENDYPDGEENAEEEVEEPAPPAESDGERDVAGDVETPAEPTEEATVTDETTDISPEKEKEN